jgi:hypothetical protein
VLLFGREEKTMGMRGNMFKDWKNMVSTEDMTDVLRRVRTVVG